MADARSMLQICHLDVLLEVEFNVASSCLPHRVSSKILYDVPTSRLCTFHTGGNGIHDNSRYWDSRNTARLEKSQIFHYRSRNGVERQKRDDDTRLYADGQLDLALP